VQGVGDATARSGQRNQIRAVKASDNSTSLDAVIYDITGCAPAKDSVMRLKAHENGTKTPTTFCHGEAGDRTPALIN
jgi:hypothetical protein